MRVMRFAVAGLFGLILTFGGLALSGCGGNPNENEFMQNAPPGKPSEFPNESVAERKARTRAEHKPGQKKEPIASAKK